MNMIAKDYIALYVHPNYQAYAEVVVSYALKGTHVPLKPDQPIPDNDGRNVTVLIQMDTDAMLPVLIPDHSCDETGLICQDHPDKPAGHNGCYGEALPCPYPDCLVNISLDRIAHRDSEEEEDHKGSDLPTEAEYLGAGS